MPPSNRAPVAKFVILTPLPIRVGQDVTVDASASFDPDGPSNKLEWTFVLGEGTRQFVGKVGTPPGKHTFVGGYSEVGLKDLMLKVIDRKGREGTLAITVDVQPVATPEPPVDCLLSEEIIVSATHLEKCQPNSTQRVLVSWIKNTLQEPNATGKPCGDTSGVREESWPCTYVPPVEPPPVVYPPSTAIVPAESRTVWQPGVQGGVPARSVIYAVLFATDFGDGALEASGAMQQAIDACPVGQVVLLSAGRWLLNNHILIHKSITVRGAGENKTFLVKTNGAGSVPGEGNTHHALENEPIAILGPSRYPTLDVATSVGLAADGIKGSYSITVLDATGLAAGVFVFLDVDDYAHANWRDCPNRSGQPSNIKIFAGDKIVFARHDPWEQGDDPFPDSLTWFSRSGRPLTEIKQIASVSGTTITFTTPLHASYGVAKSAQITRWTAPHVTHAGLEDLSVEGGSEGNVRFNSAAECWTKNVTNTKWLGKGVSLNGSFRCEVRDSYIHDCIHPYPGGGAYGVEIAWGSSEILVENNIIVGMNKAMVVESSGAGSVFGYNYVDNVIIGNQLGWVEVGINASHMVGSHHVLFEGNQACNYDSDDTHGNAHAMTIFRNHLIGIRRDYPNIQNVRCAGLMFGSYWHAFLGNVLGRDGRMDGWVYENACPWNGPTIWQLGYAPNHFEQDADPKVLETVVRDGNFDFATGTVKWDRPEQPIPDSLYLTGKPAFFGTFAWPWVDPTGVEKLKTLPARARFEALMIAAQETL